MFWQAEAETNGLHYFVTFEAEDIAEAELTASEMGWIHVKPCMVLDMDPEGSTEIH